MMHTVSLADRFGGAQRDHGLYSVGKGLGKGEEGAGRGERLFHDIFFRFAGSRLLLLHSQTFHHRLHIFILFVVSRFWDARVL